MGQVERFCKRCDFRIVTLHPTLLTKKNHIDENVWPLISNILLLTQKQRDSMAKEWLWKQGDIIMLLSHNQMGACMHLARY